MLRWPVTVQREWCAVDLDADGRMAAVAVQSRLRGKPRVLGCARSSGVSMGAHALQEVASKLGRKSPWTTALPRGDYQMVVLPEPPVLESEMAASLRWSVAPMVDFPVEANISWMRIPTAAHSATHEKQVYAVVARQSLLDEQASLFEEAKLNLKAIDVRDTALRNIAALVEKKNSGVALLTTGPGGVTITFTFRGELYLNRFIAQDMDEVVSGDEQKQLKFFERIAQQVQQSMQMITRSFPFIAVDRIVVAPTNEKLPMIALLSRFVTVPLESLDLDQHLDLSAVPALRKAENQTPYLVAIGAGLRGRSTG
ncbi:MAG TPA: hypothetical protein VK996_12380 [Ramlibacter sp.]|nr:hypothetical protein [Ramlibacter sp.]